MMQTYLNLRKQYWRFQANHASAVTSARLNESIFAKIVECKDASKDEQATMEKKCSQDVLLARLEYYYNLLLNADLFPRTAMENSAVWYADKKEMSLAGQVPTIEDNGHPVWDDLDLSLLPSSSSILCIFLFKLVVLVKLYYL